MRRSVIYLLLLTLFVTGSPFVAGENIFSTTVLAQDGDETLQGDFVPGQLIIRFKPGVTQEQISDFYAQYGLAEKESLDRDPTDRDPEMALASVQVTVNADLVLLLEDDERIEFVEPNYLLHIDQAPNDPDYSRLWGLNNTGQTGGTPDADIDAPEAWVVSKGTADVIVGVIDTGVDYTHEDLAPNIWVNPVECPQGYGKCQANGVDDDNNGYVDDFYGVNTINDTGNPMDDYGHGTHVAGTIGAAGNNGLGVVGVNWNVRIAACKFLSASGSGTVAAAVKCFQYFHQLKNRQKQNVVLTNNSWGGAVNSEALRDAMAGPDQPLHICAAGNADTDVPHFPAAFDLPNIISVAASDHNDQYASFSNHGADWVDLAAPGVDILSTVPKANCPLCSPSGYDTASGTSMATPHMSGAAALLFAAYPHLTGEQVGQRLLAAVDPLTDRSKQTATNGRLSLLNALENDPTPPAPVTDLAAAGVLLTRVNLRWTASGDDGAQGIASAYDVRYSTTPISDANWDQAIQAEGEPSPKPSGAAERFTVAGLEPGVTYYFALKVLDNVGNVSDLSNVVVTRTSEGAIVFADDMESGPDKWTLAGQDNLWHLSTQRAHSPVTAWYYGNEDTRNYDTGEANSGTLTSVAIDVAGADDALLTFAEWSQVQSNARLDRTQVQVSTDGQLWETVFESHGTEGAWAQRAVSLSPYVTATGTIHLRFWFDTVDATSNNFEGWYVDDVQVRTAKIEQPGEATPTANLVMLENNILFSPENPVEGATVTLHATVLNHGTADANDVVVQFMNRTGDSALPIGQPQTIPNIPAGGSGVAQVSYDASNVGNQEIEVVVDPNNFVPESNETDNTATRLLTVVDTPAVNLVVRMNNIGFDPPTPDPGDQVTIRATVLNTGTVEARSVTVQFNDVTGSTSTPLGPIQTIDLIPPGGSGVVETTFDTAAVDGGALGGRDIEVVADVANTIFETNERDNRAEKKLMLTPRFAPNLSVLASNIGFDPATPTAGQVVTIYATILNDGSAPASGVAVQFVEVVGSTSTPIGPQQTLETIPVGGSGLVQIAYETTNKSGDRKFEVQVDPNNFIAETRETDNKAQKTLRVASAAAPNLVVQGANINFSPGPGGASPTDGDEVTIYATILNNGAVDAEEVVVQFIDATNGATLPIGERQTITHIPAGGSGVAQVSYDTTGKVGDRAIQVVVDPNNQIPESDENDNTARDGLRVNPPPAPNLVMLASNIEFLPPTPAGGDEVTVHAVVLNSGRMDAQNVLIQFIDLTNGNATPLAPEQFIERVPAGGSATAEATFTVNTLEAGLPGARRIQVVVDSNNLITEVSESDNSALKMLPVQPSAAPNLVMLSSNIGFNPPTPTAGEPVTITAVVLNNGAAEANNVVVQVVNVTTGRPLPVGEAQVIDTIPVGGSGIAQVVLDTSGQVGAHQIRIEVDPSNLISESNETDNRNTAVLTVVRPPAANLLIQPSNIGFNPPSPVDGEPVSVTATILNHGVVDAEDVLVQFVDTTDGAFLPVGAKQTIPLIPAGGSAMAQVTYDTTHLAGERKLQVLVDPHATIPEANEADNNATQTLVVAPSPAPNLVVQEANIGFSPVSPSAGVAVTINATVLNNGNAEARTVVVQFIDITTNGAPMPIGASQTIEVIPAGGSSTVAVSYDTTGMSGDRRIQVVVDSANLIVESNETDNTARKTLEIADPTAPNLNIQAGNIGFDPPTPNPGDQVTIYATVINDGNTEATNVLVQFMDVTTSGSSIPIGEPQLIDTLPPGGSGVAQVTYDTTGMSGDRKIQVLVDPNNFVREVRETDNSAQKTLSLVAPTAPNLVVQSTNIGFAPESGTPLPIEGESVTIVATVFNDGNAPASEVTVQFLDATETPATPIGQPQVIDFIPVGGSGAAQVSYQARGQGEESGRRIQVVVDPNNFILESRETDNTATRTLRVAPSPAPNLVMLASNIGFNPPNPVAGSGPLGAVLVNVVVLNRGQLSASDVAVQLMDLTSGTAVPVAPPQVIGVIPPGSSGSTQFVYDTAGRVGDRQLLIVADPNNFIRESDESDNQATETLRVAPEPMPNLKVLPGNIKFDPPEPEQGEIVTITATILNDGSAAASDVIVEFADVTGGSGVPIGVEQTIETIEAGRSHVLHLSYRNTEEVGERTIQVTVDPNNVIAESDENDNSATKALVITPPIIPNLAVPANNLTFDPATPIAGDAVTVTVTVLNNGTGGASDVVLHIMDMTEGTGEMIGETHTVPAIPAGGSETISVTYDTTDKAGERRIQVTVDPENTIAETDEEDNVVAKTLRVLSESERPEPQANLALGPQSIQFAPITPTVGMTVTVTAVVSNTGEAAATDVIVEFTDATGGGTEVIGRAMITGTLPAGRNGRASVIYDTTNKSGVRTIEVTADPDDAIAEPDESDNQVTRTLTVTTSANGEGSPPSPPPTTPVTPTTSTLGTPNLAVLASDLAVFTPDYVVTAAETPAQITIQVTVRNLGGIDAFNVPVQFMGMGAAGWEVLGKAQVIDWLPAGGNMPLEVVIDPPAQGSYREVRVLVDPHNTIAEATKADNLASKLLADDK